MNEIVLLDGGMGQELIARSSQPASPLWSAKILLDEPELVAAVHRDYIDAGATVLTLNSYAVTPQRLAAQGSEELFERLQAQACEIVTRARDESGRDVAIAGCLPPLVASYHPEVSPSDEAALAAYRRIVAAQAEHVDLFLGETLASTAEASAAAHAALESDLPVWISLTITDDDSITLRNGEPLAETVAALRELGIDARLLNCSRPEAITAAWDVFAVGGGVTGAYANGFTSIDGLKPGGTVDALEARRDLSPEAYADFAMGWVGHGASIVGGCCEVGPAHIRHLRERLEAAGHTVVRPSSR
ncbi:MAG: homocysteine S-methyltransferase [Gammaproteobacteria bacterium]|jgi:S-methylmethionine-dependent homocysteine/selenocysteine methylase|nr:homocysteine S-methyltransferase [Gammaproteobacteria bacterium]